MEPATQPHTASGLDPERRRLGLRRDQFRFWLRVLAIAAVGLALLAIGEPTQTQLGLVILWVMLAALSYGLAFMLDRSERRLDDWADTKLAPFGLTSLLLIGGGWFVFIAALERQTHEGLGLTAFFGAVGVAVFGAGFLKQHERLVAGDEERKALRADLYQAWLLCRQPDAASSWDRVQLAARIASRADTSPLLVRGNDSYGQQLAERIADGTIQADELQACIRLLEGPGDHTWLFDRRWLYYLDRPRPKSVTQQLTSIRSLAHPTSPESAPRGPRPAVTSSGNDPAPPTVDGAGALDQSKERR
jgi:hypothetical protein